jgi:hypothetical protein
LIKIIERVHQGGDIVCDICDAVRRRGSRTAAGIPVVEDHHLEHLGQRSSARKHTQADAKADKLERNDFVTLSELEPISCGSA